jgi:hypothetical protein
MVLSFVLYGFELGLLSERRRQILRTGYREPYLEESKKK